MKSIRFFIAALFAVVLSINSFAQMHDHSHHNHSAMSTVKTEPIRVFGNCEMCKMRIEEAATAEGVSKAEWNIETKMLVLEYDPGVITSDAVQQSIATAGHDTEKFRADDKAYDSLPACCKYERE